MVLNVNVLRFLCLCKIMCFRGDIHLKMNSYNFDGREMLAQDIHQMLKQGSSNDITISLTDGQISANRDVLMARSEYFKNMLSSEFSESHSKSISFHYCSKAVMETIINFLFSGVVHYRQLSLVQLLEMSDIVRMMMINELKNHLEDYIRYQVIPESGSDITFLPSLISGLKFAVQCNLPSVEDAIINELSKNLWGLPHIQNENNFHTLPLCLLKKIIKCDSDSDTVYRNMTKERFQAFKIWTTVNHISDNDKEEIAESFDIEKFTIEDLLKDVTGSGVYPETTIKKRILFMVKERNMSMKKLKDVIKDLNEILPADTFEHILSLLGSID